MALINCPECNREISDKVKSCPHCGYPFDDEAQPKSVLPKGEAVSLDLKTKVNRKKLLRTLFGIIVLVGITALLLLFQQSKVRNTYIDNVVLASKQMLEGMQKAEGVTDLTYKVWRNTIYEEFEIETYEYTGGMGSFNTSFNTSLTKLYSDAKILAIVADIESNQKSVSTTMRKLMNPKKEFAPCYETLSEMYTTYQGFTELAVNPNGTLQSFSQNTNEKSSRFKELFSKLTTQIPVKR